MNKREDRLRRAKKTRMKIRELDAIRLSIHRTPKHIYAQVISSDGAKILVCASTLDGEIKKTIKVTGNVEAAKLVGKLIAKRAKDAGIENVAFDRSGYRYHGRIKALADAAREGGLQF
jgi:large subunit ribosomal protein L18